MTTIDAHNESAPPNRGDSTGQTSERNGDEAGATPNMSPGAAARKGMAPCTADAAPLLAFRRTEDALAAIQLITAHDRAEERLLAALRAEPRPSVDDATVVFHRRWAIGAEDNVERWVRAHLPWTESLLSVVGGHDRGAWCVDVLRGLLGSAGVVWPTR